MSKSTKQNCLKSADNRDKRRSNVYLIVMSRLILLPFLTIANMNQVPEKLYLGQ